MSALHFFKLIFKNRTVSQKSHITVKDLIISNVTVLINLFCIFLCVSWKIDFILVMLSSVLKSLLLYHVGHDLGQNVHGHAWLFQKPNSNCSISFDSINMFPDNRYTVQIAYKTKNNNKMR